MLLFVVVVVSGEDRIVAVDQSQPTRGENILDRLVVPQPRFVSIKILTLALKTGHNAIITTPTGIVISQKLLWPQHQIAYA